MIVHDVLSQSGFRERWLCRKESSSDCIFIATEAGIPLITACKSPSNMVTASGKTGSRPDPKVIYREAKLIKTLKRIWFVTDQMGA
jgi:hypothetical protein